MKNIQKITKAELVVLIIMFFSYLAALYFLIGGNRNYAVLFFVLHGVLIMVYYNISQDRFTQAILEASENEAHFSGEELEEKNKELTKLRARLEELQKQSAQAEDKLLGLQKENEELLRRISEQEISRNLLTEQSAKALLPAQEKLSRCDLIQIIHSVYEQFGSKCLQKGIKLELSTSFQQVYMNCDERYIRILLSNLIENAVKYMGRNGNFLTTISDIGAEGIFIVCKDNGNGLSPLETAHIFDLNYTGTNHEAGAGLGLVQVAAIVEHYHGTVYAKSDIGEGMAVYIQFPAENKG